MWHFQPIIPTLCINKKETNQEQMRPAGAVSILFKPHKKTALYDKHSSIVNRLRSGLFFFDNVILKIYIRLWYLFTEPYWNETASLYLLRKINVTMCVFPVRSQCVCETLKFLSYTNIPGGKRTNSVRQKYNHSLDGNGCHEPSSSLCCLKGMVCTI